MKGFQLLVAVVIALVPAGGVLDKQAIDEAFEKFIRKYNKKYTSTEERAKRRGFFAATLAQVFAANQERLDILGNGSDYVAGINSFADFSTAEFEAKMLCGYNPSISESSSPRNQSGIPYTLGHTESIRLPETVDWVAAGAVGPPRDQRTCGCCYAMQVATVAESHFQIRTGIHPMIPFSVQQLVDCSKSTGNKGCTSGSQRFAWTYVKSSGMVKESVYPFIAKDGKCKSSIVGSAANQCLAPGDIEGWFGVLPRSDDALMHKLAMYGPVPVSVHGSSARFRNYRFGVMTPQECGEGNLNHGIIVVGYGKTPKGVEYWKVINSWGTSWGDKGIGYIQRNTEGYPRGPCGILQAPGLVPELRNDMKATACRER